MNSSVRLARRVPYPYITEATLSKCQSDVFTQVNDSSLRIK